MNEQKEKNNTRLYGPAVVHGKNQSDIANWWLGIEGFARKLKVREVKTEHGLQTVADLTICAVLDAELVSRLFGDEFVNEYGNVFFRVSYWGYAAKSLAEGNSGPKKNQKVFCWIRGLSKNSFETDNSRTLWSINCTGMDMWRICSKTNPDAEPMPVSTASVEPSKGGSGVETDTDSSADRYGLGTEFSVLNDDNEELPF